MGRKLDSGKARAPKGAIPWMRHAVFGMVCVLVIGIFAWIAEPSFSLRLKSSGAEDSYYNLLEQGFRAGQLSLKREAPPGLARLADPYDPAVNAAYIGHVYDMSYYKGKLYLYFGITPALVLFWPYVTLTGHYLSDKEAVVIFFSLGFLVAAGLLRAVWRRYFPGVSIWVPTVGLLTLGLSIGTQKVLTMWCNVYEIAMVCGFAFSMMALAAIWGALHEPKRRVLWLLMASLAYGLAVGSRPSLLFGIIILLVPVAQAWRAATEPGSRRRVGLLFGAAVGPAMLIGLGLMLYNVLRFGNPFEFGWHYQLNGNYRPTTAQPFSLHYLWFGFRFYFLEPMRWSGHFPFLHAGVGDPYGGILINYPLVWLALAAPLAWRGRPGEEVSALRWFVTAVFLLFTICALTLCLFFSGSTSYELDFLPALLLLAVIGILGLERAVAGTPVWRRIVRWGWCLLLAYSVVFNLLANVEAHAEVNRLVGNFLLHQGRADEAVEHFQKALALWPESANAHGGLGAALFQKGHMDEAIIEYQKALEIEPDFAAAAEAHSNLGYALVQKGHIDEAISQFQKALETKPNLAEVHNNLGYSLLQIGRVDEAIVHYRKAIELQPESANFHTGLGNALFQKGHMDEAIIQYQEALALQPKSADACERLGNAFRRKGMAAEAMACYQKAIELQPQFILAQVDLAWMLATWPEPSVRNGGKAVALAEQANQFSKDKDPQILRTLAAAYAETGRFPEAVLTAKQALALAMAQSNTGLTNALQTEIGLYQTNSPCRSTNN
jgi:tetratricopeptide (TPR) repeat protein